MIKKTQEKIKLAIFVLLGSIMFTAGIYLIGNQQTLFGSSFELVSVFRNVNGLKVGNNVRFSGINVGTVGDITMISDTVVEVVMYIEEEIQVHIKTDAIATISSDGLVGSMIVNIIPGNGATQHVQTGDIVESYSKIGTDDMLTTLNVTNENAALLTSDLLKITSAINDGKGTLGLLLTDTVLADNLSNTVLNLKLATESTVALLDKLEYTVGQLNNDDNILALMLRDSVAASDLKATINNLNEASQEISVTLANLNGLMGDVKNGEGVVTTLLYDSAVAESLEGTIYNLNESTELLNENLEALKHSFPVKKYFKKQAKEEAKLAADSAKNTSSN
jgi:phospholipid/cholesterol/gamma-HCH transport system substrate-binding protein